MHFRLICIFILLSFSSFAQEAALSPRVANYDMQVSLDTMQKKVTAHTTLRWKNISTDTVGELQFHLYYNAFRNTESTFFKERGLPDFFSKTLKEDCEWAWMEIQKMTDEDGNDLVPNMEYIQPDDDNAEDRTVLRVPLSKAVLPGETITIDYDWQSRVPRTMIRTGYNRDYYFMAQWFPKVGVYEPAGMRFAKKGQWNCHQYHSSGEYYSDFGVYNVDITVPSDFIVGASGVLQNVKDNGSTKTWSFYVEDVIDYTWSASPHFVEQKEEWKGVSIRLLCYPDHEVFAKRYFDAIKNSLEFFEEHLWKYPYPTLTIIDPPFHGLFSVGMEYPTLITTGTALFIPDGVRTAETLTVHEFIHQYFMQMVATHEQEEPWLDEGFTTYYEGRIMDQYYGEHSSTIDWMGMKVGNAEYNRIEFFGMDNPEIAPNTLKSREFPRGAYGPISYNKTAIWMRTLEGMLGIETMDEIMKTYFDRWKFNHPCRNDFIDVVNEVVRQKHGNEYGEDMNWFFDQVLYGTDLCDYTVSDISNIEVKEKLGVFEQVNECIKATETESEEEDENVIYESTVEVERLGNLAFPVDVRIEFEDGKVVLEQWKDRKRSKSYFYKGTTKVVCAEVDPDRKIYIDKNFLNNSLTKEPSKVGTRKYFTQFMFWLQNTMLSLSAMV